jgi:prophage DNA circulation protein
MAAKDIHNPWRDALLPASFDGNEFFVDVGGRESGNRLVVHQFPKKDIPYTENMGRRAFAKTVRGYVIQSARRPDYRPARDALVQRLEQGMAGKAGRLQLPTMRPVTVICQTYRLTEEERLGGYAVFDMHFVEAGSAPFKPTASPQAQLSQRATALSNRTLDVIAQY